MVVDRPGRARAHGSTWLLIALLLIACGTVAPRAEAQDHARPVEGFGESHRGDIPEGTLEMMTPETDEAIKNGLDWLARSQNSDGSYGSGAYRGNIAVTSLA